VKALIVSSGPPEALGPIAQVYPVGALPFLGRSLIAHQLARLCEAGVREVLVAMHHAPDQLEKAIRTGTPPGLRIRTTFARTAEGPWASVREHRGFCDETTLVVMADAALLGDLAGAIAQHRATGSALTALLGDEGPTAWLVEPGLLARDPFPLEELAQGLVSGTGSHADPRHGHRVSDPVRYRRALFAGSPDGVVVDPGARIHPEARLVGPAWIGPGCRIEREAQVGPRTVLTDGVQVGRGARVEDSVVLGGTRLGLASTWRDRLVWRCGSFPLGADPADFSASDDVAPTVAEPWDEVLAAGLDWAIALFALIALAPLWLLIAFAIVLDDPGPVFFSQLRVGQDPLARRLGRLQGRVFELYKFRTMAVGAERQVDALLAENAYGASPFFKLEQDPRVTRVGRFLRATSLDELPQLLNVVLGDMRLVGCRPLPLYEAAALQEDWQRLRFACPAGITGLWQISGRSDLSAAERMVLDSYYSVTRTLWTDWGILLRTVPALLLQKGAR
jgi:lipopolysaccharide/colanic/teichoic acid biosynthesis glycosyltransferase